MLVFFSNCSYIPTFFCHQLFTYTDLLFPSTWDSVCLPQTLDGWWSSPWLQSDICTQATWGQFLRTTRHVPLGVAPHSCLRWKRHLTWRLGEGRDVEEWQGGCGGAMSVCFPPLPCFPLSPSLRCCVRYSWFFLSAVFAKLTLMHGVAFILWVCFCCMLQL